MGFPKKALKEHKLNTIKKIGDGSHETYLVTFMDDGILKTGYYKKLEPHNDFPELLGKISVGVALIKRSFQARSAEERIVINKHRKMTGIVSVALDNFTPFIFDSEEPPTDPIEREKVIPSTKTLIEKNFMELLTGRYYVDDDDPHAHNWGLDGDIDNDMAPYWLVIYMKKPRPIIGIPKLLLNFTVTDWERFPNVKDSLPFHWPAYDQCGQETFPTAIHSAIASLVLTKNYPDPQQFRNLAKDPRAKEQQLAAALKILLTHQPEKLKERLTEAFGDMPLNYYSLDEVNPELRPLYESKFPQLFNEKTNAGSFVDFMLAVNQIHYDSLYKIVVFYMGCEDNGFGIPLPATCVALYNKPSYYRHIEAWVKEQNLTVSVKYDLNELQKRYHQIWRNAFTPMLNILYHSCYQLFNKWLLVVSKDMQLPEKKGKTATDDSLEHALELLNSMPELSRAKIEPLIVVDKNSNFRDGLLLFVDFLEKLQDISNSYYRIDRARLTEEDNGVYVRHLKVLYEEYNVPIRKKLLHTTMLADEFNSIGSLLSKFTEQVNFELHLTTTDEQMKQTLSMPVFADSLPHTHEKVIAQYLDCLFEWARDIDVREFNEHITNILMLYDPPASSMYKMFSTRKRALPVREYLANSEKERGDTRLAYIFSSSTQEDGALNQLLIQHLTKEVLIKFPIVSICNAQREKAFEKTLVTYAHAAVNYSKENPKLVHLYSQEGIALFYTTMYSWITKRTPKQFQNIIATALKQYEYNLAWGSAGRRGEVELYQKRYTNQAKIIAKIFVKGESTSTLNSALFLHIIGQIKESVAKHDKYKNLPGFRLIMQYSGNTHHAIYEQLREHSKKHAHIRDEKTSHEHKKPQALSMNFG